MKSLSFLPRSSCFRTTHESQPIRGRTAYLTVLLAVFVSVLFSAQVRGAEWKKNITIDGIAYDQVKVEPDGKTIGYLAAAAEIRERPCARDWVHLHPNGELALFKLQRDLELPVLKLPADTWVFQNENGLVVCCAFPKDTEVQGQLCRGTGGPKGAQVALYDSGRLKQFFPTKPTRIDVVLCDTSLIKGSVVLYENGRLKSCLLAEDLKQEAKTFSKGMRVKFDETGKAIAE